MTINIVLGYKVISNTSALSLVPRLVHKPGNEANLLFTQRGTVLFAQVVAHSLLNKQVIPVDPVN